MAEYDFSWIETYKGLIQYLSTREQHQQELIGLLKSVGIGPFNDKTVPLEGFDSELDEIDPFTFLCYINKYGTERKLIYLNEIAMKLNLPQATGDSGLPSAQAQKVWLFPYKFDRTNNEIKRLWDLFHHVLANTLSDPVFEDALQIRSVGETKLTEVLFYVDPIRYLPINGPTIPYLQQVLHIDTKFNSHTEYVSLLQKIRHKSNLEFYELSFKAWEWNVQQQKSRTNQKYWLYAPGENASEWEEFYEKGIMGLGWDYLGDLQQYSSKEEIVKALQEYENTSSSKKNDATANWDFKEGIKPGDIVIAKKGRKEYLGYGIVTSDYYYDDTRTSYHKIRTVEWKKKGSWIVDDNSVVLKTLTDISKYPEYVNNIIQLIGIKQVLNETISDKMINQPLNQILYGPPGTGKTYHTINQAIAIIAPDFDLKQNREQIKRKYDELVKAGQIVFTTFHQSMSYEDFIEGIKPLEPKNDDSPINYKIKDGIFKEISRKAKENKELSTIKKRSKDNIPFDIAFNMLVEKVQSALLNDPITEDNNHQNGFVIQLASSYFSITGINGASIRMMTRTGNEQNTMTRPTLQTIYEDPENLNKYIVGGMRTYYKALVDEMINWKDDVEVFSKDVEAKNYVLIIDEINRGNVSQIFGELITLLEDDKRLGNAESLQVTLPYSKEKFGVPSNLYIIGTMNTADRSVEALDAALRRRFSFTEMPPVPDLIKTEGKVPGGMIGDIDLANVLSVINKRIELLLDKDHQIGHSYFLSVEHEEDLKAAFKNKIIPLLQEYFFGDYGKIGLVLGSGFVSVDKNTDSSKLFARFDDLYDASDLAERTIYNIVDVEDKNFDIQSVIKSLLN